MKNQDRATKPCECGRGQAYTDNRPGVPKLNGKNVCEDCYVDHLKNQALNRRAE
jgi:hypothetical protein